MASGAASTRRREPWLIDLDGLGALVEVLSADGYRVVGPRLRDGVIVTDALSSADDLPVGWTDAQSPGSYRAVRRADDARFGFAVGPQGPRRFLSPPRTTLWSARRTDDGIDFAVPPPESPPVRYAFVGVRACEIAAIEVQDRVFRDGPHPDRSYVSLRETALVVAVQCGDPASTCFCASMGTGPRADAGYDLALTELVDGTRHDFVVEVGSDRGAEILSRLPARPASTTDVDAAVAVTTRAQEQMTRALDPHEARVVLARSPEHPRWDEVAERCLGCANCTLVCPTCFCSTVEDVTDLDGASASHVRRWDSCFTLEHSLLHGGSVRTDTRSRYRQWLTHKLSTWWDQFDVSGCVGCGRCITWCPVGIDLVEEVSAMAGGATDRE